jgi:hypothetical protein
MYAVDGSASKYTNVPKYPVRKSLEDGREVTDFRGQLGRRKSLVKSQDIEYK